MNKTIKSNKKYYLKEMVDIFGTMEIIIKVNLKMVKKGKSKYVYQDG
jgi:hypothetical protein